MRFSKLALEKYGRFENCAIDLRQSDPDFHVIYGPNEAGKTTALAAIADLLFGFPSRSPYNFRFDYPLLRVGAVLQDGTTTLECRRRKSGQSTLVDKNDRPVDENVLRTMLNGQTRETFRHSFSLDQDGLRRGGQAMLDARNDLGQTLFAAGSGLTGISQELKRLEEDADSIWGKRAKSSRIYTQWEKQLESSVRIIRDAAMKPKTWTDAKRLLENAEETLAELESSRDQLQAEIGKSERVRRVAGHVRLRQEIQERISSSDESHQFSIQAETEAERAMKEVETASRARSVSERLLKELEEKIADRTADPEAVAEESAIEQLVVDSGAVSKAAKDLLRLRTEKSLAEAALDELRAKAEIPEGAALSNDAIKRLRELANAHARDASALAQIAESERDLERQRKVLSDKLEQSHDDTSLASLNEVVDDALRLGSDVDERCTRAERKVTTSKAKADSAVSRLHPWKGAAADLTSIPLLGTPEIEEAKRSWAIQTAAITTEENETRRLDEAIAKLQSQITRQSNGTAISETTLTVSRTLRDDHWKPLKAHILGNAIVDDVSSAAAQFEGEITAADDIADRRFGLADASARLATLQTNLAESEMEAEQARERAKVAFERLAELERNWKERLLAMGLPELEPVQIEAWFVALGDAIKLHDEYLKFADEAEELAERRASAVDALYAALEEEEPVDKPEMAGVLARAERLQREKKKNDDQLRSDRQNLSRLEDEIGALQGRRDDLLQLTSPREADWIERVSTAGLDLDIATSDERLSVLDDLRQAAEGLKALSRRIDGMVRDSDDFQNDLREVAERLGIEMQLNAQDTVRILQNRLMGAHNVQRMLDDNEIERTKRQSEIDQATAECDAAMETISPLLKSAGLSEFGDLSNAIERSRALRRDQAGLVDAEAEIVRDGDGLSLTELVTMVLDTDFDTLMSRRETMARELKGLNEQISEAAKAHGDAMRAFTDLEHAPHTAADAASDAEQARAEMTLQAEDYILKRAQGLALRWTIEQYRERHQDPLLVRASELFSVLTLGRYETLHVELDETAPRLLGVTDGGRTAIGVEAMSEGTTDQLFLALRLASLEQSVAAGVILPFLADDLFVNFDDHRAEAGFRVLTEISQKTQVLFFTHHPHLAALARSVVGDGKYSECGLT